MTAVERVRAWRLKNPDRVRVWNLARYHRHAATINAARRASPRLDVRKWAAKNPEKVLGYKKKWAEANRDRRSAAARAWIQKNRARVLPLRLALENKRRTSKLGCLVHHTPAEWSALCARYGGRCLACGRSDLLLSRDHVVPLSRGGDDSIANIQPLCRSCNAKKGTKATDYRIDEADHARLLSAHEHRG